MSLVFLEIGPASKDKETIEEIMNQPFQIIQFEAMLNPLPIAGFHPHYFQLPA